ncbi:HD domain-containing protein [Arenibacter algicola]|uniref:Putative hydrolase n=1 Tax=Arenibacter algicola TaxID=616991 RepID=A0A221UUL1_9FLAO|nr:HD domain-containing protein [Arenibacter algicola]ASO05014.1 putative hydrolase [Arenibacter algicola]HCO84680.1 HD domain-containing protein [Arenibacter sp.]|tara:strand:+ start:159 stop:815 length:657 start_codon:yes stop_codon:yes gene_type:complete
MTNTQIIEETIAFVKEILKGAEGGHDWFHIQRVFKNTLLIAKDEKVDVLVVSLGALLHDIADAKFNGGDETVGPKMASVLLQSLEVDKKIVDHVVKIIENISYKSSLDSKKLFTSKELQVVQDADRLDAIGAIGIARAFNYGGFKNRELYNPEIAPNLQMTKEEYKKSKAPTINHFYEKLLLLKDKMNTESGKKLAEKRHEFMLDYLEQFYKEWNGNA